MIRRLLLTLCLLLPSHAWADANFPNEPAGASTVLNCAFTNALCSGMYNAYNTLPFAQPGLSGFVSAPWVLNQEMAVNSTFGNGQWGLILSPKVQEIFLGVSWGTNSDFQGYSNNNNKTLFLKGGVDNSFLVWQGSPGSSKVLKWYQQSQVDNCHISSFNAYPGPTGCWNDPNPGTRDGTGWFNPNINSAVATFGAGGVHKVEIYLKASTTGTSKDGIVRIWVDGTLSSDFTNVNLTPGGFSEWTFNAAWDGTGSCASRDCSKAWNHYLDHVLISVPNCPLGCPGGGTTPPPSTPTPTPQPPAPESGNYVYQSQFSGTQGTSQWSYRDTAGNLLTYNGGSSLWQGIQSYQGIWSSGFHPGTSNGTVLRWTAPEGGTATITGSAQKQDLGGGDGTTFEIKHGATVKFTQALGGTDGTAYPYNVSQAMTTGQTIDFIVTPGANNVHDSTWLNPTIAWAPTSGSAPTVASFLPTSGAAGTSVVITGTNFVPSISGNTVSFSGIAANVTAASTTSITATVPQNAITGTVSVATTLGTGTSAGNFTVPLTGTVGDVNDLSVSATGTTTALAQLTAVTDGTGNPSKYNIRIAEGLISWGSASAVAAGTCTTPFNPGVANQLVTCTITGLTVGTEYQLQLVAYKGTIGVDAVYGNISNLATVTTQGTILDVPIICEQPVDRDELMQMAACEHFDQVSFVHD